MSVLRVTVTISPAVEGIPVVRRFVRSAVVLLHATVDLEVVELLTSELTSNAVRLAAGDVTVAVISQGRGVRVEVHDYGYGRPEVDRREIDLTRKGGQGLHLVDVLANGWGVDEFLPGKIVWFELDPLSSTDDARVTPARRPRRASGAVPPGSS